MGAKMPAGSGFRLISETHHGTGGPIEPKVATVWLFLANCPRCEQGHKIYFRRLDNPSDGFDLWGICSQVQQPVMARSLIEENGRQHSL